MENNIEISSSNMKFPSLLNLIDKAIFQHKKITISKNLYDRNVNNSIFLKWLDKHKIVELDIKEAKKPMKSSKISSKKRKIEISLMLKSLGASIKEVADIFGVTEPTAKGYLKSLDEIDKTYMKILNIALKIKGISIVTVLTEFPEFPVSVNEEKFMEKLSESDYNKLEDYVHSQKLIQYVTGKNLGTRDLSIIFPEK